MNKTDLLFQMLEQPERYSEAQWQEILADDECRELYTLMAKVKSTAPSPEVSGETIDAEWERLAQSQRPRATIIPMWRKVAATAAIALVLFGVCRHGSRGYRAAHRHANCHGRAPAL